jgi:hypothetical protein
MSAEPEVLRELIQLRVHEQHLAHNLTEAVHLFYCTLFWVATQPESDFKRSTLAFIRVKFHQMPQASGLGRMFIDLDKQFGNSLESNGVNIERWVFEPRGRWNG